MAQSTAAPLRLRMASGDIAAARASLIVVSHFNGLKPTGAEAAIDAALGGAISRRAAAGALDSQFGASQFLPTANAPLAAEAVLVLGLGEPGKLDPRRLGELGAAIADAMAVIGAPDAATVVHGAGTVGVAPGLALRRLLKGFVAARDLVEDDAEITRLTLVEFEPDRIQPLRGVLRDVAKAPRVSLERETQQLGRAARTEVDVEVTRKHLRVAVTRSAQELKVTRITDEAYDAADRHDYPTDKVVRLLEFLEEKVLGQRGRPECASAMKTLGRQLYREFFAWPQFGLRKDLRASRNGYLVLRLDESTVDLPWELLLFGDQFLARSHALSRQREINAPGHAAAYVDAHKQLRVLVIGNPTSKLPRGNLAGAEEEARHVTKALRARGAAVTELIGEATHAEVLEVLHRENPDVLHFAGHARFDSVNQATGGLLLSDGLLTAATLAAQPHLPRLVFANACGSAQTGDPTAARAETAASATRDLAGGILRAGARAFIGSQWPVTDDAARTFAEAFYEHVQGETIGSATRRAREKTISAHGLAEPTWAGYSLYGAPWATAL